jgi:hypothetical protein
MRRRHGIAEGVWWAGPMFALIILFPPWHVAALTEQTAIRTTVDVATAFTCPGSPVLVHAPLQSFACKQRLTRACIPIDVLVDGGQLLIKHHPDLRLSLIVGEVNVAL